MNYKIITQDNLSDFKFDYDAKVISLDLETTSLRPKFGLIRLMQINDGKNIYVLDLFRLNKDWAIAKLKPVFENFNVKKIIHNAKFEGQWLKEHFDTSLVGVFDTSLASKLLDYNKKASLDDVALRYLGVVIPKDQQSSNWANENLSQAQYDYAAKDVLYLHKLREVMGQEIHRSGQVQVAKLEFEAAAVLGYLENDGFYIDKEQWKEICVHNKENLEIQAEIFKNYLYDKLNLPKSNYDKIFNLFGEEIELENEYDINIGSNAQVLKALNKIGIPTPSTTNKVINTFINDYPDLKLLVNYRKAEKLVSSFGEAFFDFIDADGRIRPNFWQLGAFTGRMSSSKPNLQQIPKEELYRSAFKPEYGNKLIISDYSGCELRIAAHISQDKAMMQAFIDGKDLHAATAAKMFGVTYEQALSDFNKSRSKSKAVNFGIIYGMGASSLATRIGVPFEEAQDVLNKYLDTYPQLSKWFDKIEGFGVANGYVRGLSGRKMFLSFDREDFKSINGAKRNARNCPIQSSNADMTKTAVRYIYDRLKSRNYHNIVKFCNCVHDEVVVECPEYMAEDVKIIVQEEMVRAGEDFVDSVPIIAEASIASSWSEK